MWTHLQEMGLLIGEACSALALSHGIKNVKDINERHVMAHQGYE